MVALRALVLLSACAMSAPDPAAASGVTAASRRIDAAEVRQATALRVDGDLNDAVWQDAPAVDDFRQRDPHEGATATLRSEVRAAYDASSLYVAVRAFDPEPSRIVGMLTRRDGQSPSDWIRIYIDSYHDRRTAYEFSVNPAGVKQDTYWFNDGQQDLTWDAVWDVDVSTDANGWKAEFRIPFSQLRFNPNDTTAFGFAVSRTVARLNETSTWPLLSKGANGYVSQFGELAGVQVRSTPKRLELLPYAVGQIATSPDDAENPLVNSLDPGGALGLDLKFAVTPGLTLTGTVNPDFGQVEADPAVVNLSAFETFFAERRPFFVEGSGVFRFDINCSDGQCTGLFYSRRIGRTPRGEADVPEGGHSVAPHETTILGAAKLTGRAGKFSVGVLNAVTADERAVIASGIDTYHQNVEPLTSYSVARMKREFQDQSSIGFMMTGTNRRLTESVRFLPGQAYTGGVDWDWRLTGKYAIAGYWAGSTVRGNSEAIDRLQQLNQHSFQRPDADHLDYDPTRTAINGHAANLSLSKIGGQRVRFNTNVGYKTPGFDINDVGFFRRADEIVMGNWLQLRYDTPNRWKRSLRVNFNQWSGWNFGGDHRYAGANINAHATFTNNWTTGGGFNVEKAGFDDRATRGGPGARVNAGLNYWHYVNTDDRKPVSVEVSHSLWADAYGSRTFDLGPTVTYRPTPALSVTGGISYTDRIEDSQWIENLDDASGTRHVFGRLEQTTLSLTGRVNYTVTPTLSIETYMQPFVSAGDYSGFKQLVNGRAARYADRYARFGYGDNPDFNYRSFRTTNVLRWEYRPGSTLFVVWQQGREDTIERGDFRFGRDVRGVFSAPARNVFLVKAAYWFNY